MCEICMCDPCDCRCPNYIPIRTNHYCSICNEGIYEGEEYIENDDGECIHYECVHGIRSLLEWIGYKIKYMEDGYD